MTAEGLYFIHRKEKPRPFPIPSCLWGFLFYYPFSKFGKMQGNLRETNSDWLLVRLI
jgi:hypothetical protein